MPLRFLIYPFLFYLCLSQDVIAENCPSSTDIRYRLVPDAYEWTVDEGITLEKLLSVERLISVSLENNGEFVSCKYEVEKQFLKLDGLPKKEGCRVVLSDGQWITTKTGRSICDEEDASECLFSMSCNE